MADTVHGMQPIARRLREIIVDIHPDYVEVVRLGDRAANVGVPLSFDLLLFFLVASGQSSKNHEVSH